MDEALLLWFREKIQVPDVTINGATLKEQAVFFAKKLGFNDADIDSSWINRFKKRHGILQVKKCGEEACVNEEVLETWHNGKLREILSTYSPSDIFNFDETAIFWKMLPEQTLGFSGTTHHGFKRPKTRLTALVGANMDGSEKYPLLVIGKFKNPRAFKNVTHLPLIMIIIKRPG